MHFFWGGDGGWESLECVCITVYLHLIYMIIIISSGFFKLGIKTCYYNIWFITCSNGSVWKSFITNITANSRWEHYEIFKFHEHWCWPFCFSSISLSNLSLNPCRGKKISQHYDVNRWFINSKNCNIIFSLKDFFYTHHPSVFVWKIFKMN